MWRNQSQWHFCVVNSTFIFTFIYGFLQALKQDNKKYLFKCTVGFPVQFQSVQCNSSTLIGLRRWRLKYFDPPHPMTSFFFSFLFWKKKKIHSTEWLGPDVMKQPIKAHHHHHLLLKRINIYSQRHTFFFNVSSLLLLIITIWSHSLFYHLLISWFCLIIFLLILLQSQCWYLKLSHAVSLSWCLKSQQQCRGETIQLYSHV